MRLLLVLPALMVAAVWVYILRRRLNVGWLWIAACILIAPAIVWATGTLTIPNTIFTQPGGTNVAPVLDANFAAIANYVNAREITFDVLANRPVAGTHGRIFSATDQNGGTLYADTGTSWSQLAAAVSATLATSISSLTITNNSTATASFIVQQGQATSDDASLGNRVLINNTADITKRLTATWTVGSGNGCLDAGAVAVFTWYHVFIINRIDTGVTDVLCSLSPAAPTMPTNYTKKRRIGSIRTDWSLPAGSIYFFNQQGDRFRWATVSTTLDVSNAAPGVLANAATLSTPNGVTTLAIIMVASPAGGGSMYVRENNTTDEVPAGASTCGNAGGAPNVSCQATVYTDQASGVSYRSTANAQVSIQTLGWFDRRGQQ